MRAREAIKEVLKMYPNEPVCANIETWKFRNSNKFIVNYILYIESEGHFNSIQSYKHCLAKITEQYEEEKTND